MNNYNKKLEIYTELLKNNEEFFNIDWLKRNILGINPLYEERKRKIEKILKGNNE